MKRGYTDPVTDVTHELTIDELARETGMTVRNIRAHQSRGLLPPPEVRARTGYYGPQHATRLNLIQELQGDGYNLAAIKHLLERAATAPDEVLGFARNVLTPFESEQPEVVEAQELGQRYGDADPKLLARAEKLRLIVPLGGGRYEIPSPTLQRAGDELAKLGVPLERQLDIVEQVGKSSKYVSDTFVKLFLEQVWKPFDRAGQPEEDWPQVNEALERLRPLATETLVAVFQQRMTVAVERAFGRELEKRGKA
jgi:DNA-binding transcriptional MerR regulator